MTTQNTQALVTDAERAEFESIFPTPSACIWHGNGYAATGYNAWDAHKHIERWNGWRSARQSSAQSDASPESEDLQKTKAQLAQAEQEITAYDMTMNRQSKLIAELEAQLEAVGAGGVTALIPKAERERAAVPGEREAFERWQCNALGRDLQELSMNASGDYDCGDIQCEWEAWQARAALAATLPAAPAQPLAQPAPVDADVQTLIDSAPTPEPGQAVLSDDQALHAAWAAHVAPLAKKFDTSSNNNFFAAGWSACRAYLAAVQVQAMLAAERASKPEPFGHFKVEPFGWTDCAETDEGAIALYEAPQPQQVAEPAVVEPVQFKGGMTATDQSRELDAGFAAQNYCRSKWGAARGHAEWRRYHDAFVAGYLAAPQPAPAVVDQTPVAVVAVVDEDEDGLFADFETEIGVVVKRGDKLYAAPHPQQIAGPESEPMLRFCPGCGSCGPVPAKFRDCCPDGGDSRVIPASLANKCRDLFRLAVAKATTKESS